MPIIIVVEPHPLLRLGILQLLSACLPDSHAKGIDYSALSEVHAEDQGCELLMLSIPSFEDIQKLTAAASHAYDPKSILLLSESSSMPDWVHNCPPTVAGYVPKNAAPEVLQASVKLVLAGGTCFPLRSSPSAAEKQPQPATLVQHLEPISWPDAGAAATVANTPASECEKLGLTPRQYEVLVLLARGYPMKTVGRLLNISVATAKAHTEMLYQRLDVHSRNAAVYVAVSRGATLGWPNIKTAKQQAALS
ncbi:response regulator transcription factor [Pusillimonas sp. SM2304]|uniref:response regulator transcription factor n=1 Tax=Pusillimonas sp. SM2304 TaxID=3073241 RepID=UPI002875B27B|nr:response regulator transcription factor [Pusillimonas sp. SM2304]MDS1141658.1 response regulator transcription factor [Pusillimonas sp. SM2304]